MEDAKTFKEKNLATAQRTMETLQQEKIKRERDLYLLRISEPKLVKELNGLKESIVRMQRDMQVNRCDIFNIPSFYFNPMMRFLRFHLICYSSNFNFRADGKKSFEERI